MKNYLIPRLSDIFFLAILIAALMLGPRMMSLDSDLGRHLTLGNYILEAHHVPTRDLLSHTRADAPRPAYEWLTQILFALANRAAGLDGVVTLTALFIAAAFASNYSDASRRSGWPLLSLGIAILAAAASSLHWLPRPHVVTFLLLAIWIERLERVRRGENLPLWQLPALMLVWVNAHGGFIFGMLAWLAYFAGWVWERIGDPSKRTDGRRWLIIGGTSLTATFITPSGWGNWQAVLNNRSQYILSHTVETMPPDFSQAGARPFLFLLMVTVLCVFSILAARKHLPMAHAFLLGGFGILGLMMARNIPLFAIAAAPILSEMTASLLGDSRRWKKIEGNIASLERPLRGAAWPILFGLGFALMAGIRCEVRKEAATRFDARLFPVAAADWLSSHPQLGNMFNDFNWGGYLLYRFWPEQKVFIDSQTDFYGEALVREYEQIWTAQAGWQDALERYRVEWAILPRSAPLVNALEDAGWQTMYQDETTIILQK